MVRPLDSTVMVIINGDFALSGRVGECGRVMTPKTLYSLAQHET